MCVHKDLIRQMEQWRKKTSRGERQKSSNKNGQERQFMGNLLEKAEKGRQSKILGTAVKE